MNIASIVAAHAKTFQENVSREILALLGGNPAAPKAPKATKKAPRKAKKAAKAPSAAVTDLAAAIGNFVQENPGSAAEAIRQGTGIGKGAWAKAAKAAVTGGVCRTEGQKRAMKYFPATEAA